MVISVERTNLHNVLLFEHDCHEDHRGTYEELYNIDTYSPRIRQLTGHEVLFHEDDIAVSTKHVLRGIHGDSRTWKLVTCLLGRFYIVVVRCTQDEYFGQWQSFVLSDKNKRQVLVPPYHGHGYLVMSEHAIFHYKQSCVYHGAAAQFTYKYDDPKLGIWWPVKNPILSLRDDRGYV